MLRKPIIQLLGVVFVSGIALFILGLYKENHALRMLSKPIPLIVLILLLLSYMPSKYTQFLVIGLILSLIGDLLLEYSQAAFLPGLIAFLLAHLIYILAYLQLNRQFCPFRLILVLVPLIVVYLLLLPYLGDMVLPVLIYTLVIGIMLWRSLSVLDFKEPTAYQLALVVGALLFVVSDIILAWNRFHTPFQGARYLVILLYWAGQGGIALSGILQARSRL